MILSATPRSIYHSGFFNGNSPEAIFVAQKTKESHNSFRETHSIGGGKKAAFDELWAVANECRDSNWDGYDARPVEGLTVLKACQFLETIPLDTHHPSVSASPDGNISFDWDSSSSRSLSVSIGSDGSIHYAALLGPNKTYGTEYFFGDAPKNILEIITRVYI
jgi:hypothetical protein